jgi:transcriptional regulator with XRE-family HTH domain
VRKTESARPVAEIARDLRSALNHTQQSFAVALGWSISSAVRFENGAQPSARMLAQMVDLAHASGLDDLAMELQTHLNVSLGPNFPVGPDETERLFILLARRAFQNRKRHAAFLKALAPEIEILKAENAIRKEHQDRLNAELDAITGKAKAKR